MASGSIAQYQGVTFFLSDDGFYMCDGQNVTAIGAEKVDRFFLQDASESDFKTMSAAVDLAGFENVAIATTAKKKRLEEVPSL